MAKADKKISTAKQPIKKNPVGAPRTVTPPPDKVIELGKEMVQWFLDNPTALHFTRWYSVEKGILRKEWDTMTQKPEFLAYYEKVRNIILERMMHGTIKEGIAHRYLSLVDTELRDHERAIKQEDAEIKAQESKAFTDEDNARLDSLLNQIKDLQAKKSAS